VCLCGEPVVVDTDLPDPFDDGDGAVVLVLQKQRTRCPWPPTQHRLSGPAALTRGALAQPLRCRRRRREPECGASLLRK
jgi:hypothetical protein